MNGPLKRIEQWLDGVSRRERVLAMAAGFGVLVLIWNFLVLVPLETRQERAQQGIEQTQTRISSLEARREAATVALSDEPDGELQRRRQELREALARAEEALEDDVAVYVSPEEMVDVLHALLESQPGLRLDTLETLEPQRLIGPDEESPPVYRHTIELEFTGDFSGTQVYLQQLRALRGRLLWEQLDYAVERHPEARVRLRLHTLSVGEDALGV